ncbi:MAG: hypothetical protein RMX96_05615 [Nostoc sp. ChiSLP02]|nr:hypothetical protein [Nostoc sp. DedSLP05]MDZ8103753.1 hypothetical protein [Nostoc sp. DedSLP01]MDZ8184328.1 hypothetical protein [Nostoc sp. ChiSLP02]
MLSVWNPLPQIIALHEQHPTKRLYASTILLVPTDRVNIIQGRLVDTEND